MGKLFRNKLNTNCKQISFISSLVLIFFCLLTIVFCNISKIEYFVEEENANEFVYLDDYAIKINNVSLIKEEDENLLVFDIIVKQNEESISGSAEFEIFIDNKRITSDYRENNEEEDIKEISSESEKRFFPIDEDVAEKFLNGEMPKVVYVEKSYLSEMSRKSTKDRIYRKIGIVKNK